MKVKLEDCNESKVCLTGNYSFVEETDGTMSKITAVQGVCTGRVACSSTTFCDYLKKQTPEVLDCTVKNVCSTGLNEGISNILL